VSEDVDSLGRFDVSVIVVLVGENDKDSHGIICKRNSKTQKKMIKMCMKMSHKSFFSRICEDNLLMNKV
jgi:hypothetical protein